MEAADYCEALINTKKITLCHAPKEHKPNLYRYKNLKSNIGKTFIQYYNCFITTNPIQTKSAH
jgi:hypothetical protein